MFSSLHIHTQTRNGKTFLKSNFCTPPFKIADVTSGRTEKELRLMIMSSSPGVLDEDEYQLQVDLSAGSFLRLETQSYQRLFKMKSTASQKMEVRMQEGSSLIYLPHPVVPHEDSNFVCRNRVFMSNHCDLTWGEVLTCGRKLNGESFSFSSFHNITEIFLDGRLIVKENLMIQPSVVDPLSIGQLEGFTHQATLIMINEKIAVKELIENMRLSLADEKSIAFGVTELAVKGLLVRILGCKAEQLFELIKNLSVTGTNMVKETKEISGYAS
jgi:urease accessory protein